MKFDVKVIQYLKKSEFEIELAKYLTFGYIPKHFTISFDSGFAAVMVKEANDEQ